MILQQHKCYVQYNAPYSNDGPTFYYVVHELDGVSQPTVVAVEWTPGYPISSDPAGSVYEWGVTELPIYNPNLRTAEEFDAALVGITLKQLVEKCEQFFEEEDK